jgi:hypothetical protein
MIKKTIKQCCPNYYYFFKYLFLEYKKKEIENSLVISLNPIQKKIFKYPSLIACIAQISN